MENNNNSSNSLVFGRWPQTKTAEATQQSDFFSRKSPKRKIESNLVCVVGSTIKILSKYHAMGESKCSPCFSPPRTNTKRTPSAVETVAASNWRRPPRTTSTSTRSGSRSGSRRGWLRAPPTPPRRYVVLTETIIVCTFRCRRA